MSKKYVFTLDKYYTEDEIAKVSPIIENFVNFYADEKGVAVLPLKDDVSVIVKRDEGLVLHMVLDNPDNFTALPKKLTKAKDFLRTFIVAMAEAVEEKKRAIDIASAKTKVENDAEDALLGYITPKADAPTTNDAPAADTPAADTSAADTPAPATETKTTVKVNGKEITDPEEKKKVIADMEAKKAELKARANKMFNDTFDKVFKSLATDDWLSKYLN